jgi:hypothetical protein
VITPLTLPTEAPVEPVVDEDVVELAEPDVAPLELTELTEPEALDPADVELPVEEVDDGPVEGAELDAPVEAAVALTDADDPRDDVDDADAEVEAPLPPANLLVLVPQAEAVRTTTRTARV